MMQPWMLYVSLVFSVGFGLIALTLCRAEGAKRLVLVCFPLGIALTWPVVLVVGFVGAVLFGVWTLLTQGLASLVVLLRGYEPKKDKS